MKSKNHLDKPFNLKREATTTELHSVAKKGRISSELSEDELSKEVSHVVSDDNVTKVERRTSSGRKVKFVCYRMLDAGLSDRSGKATSVSPDSEKNGSPLVTQAAKSDPIPHKVCKSPSEKALSIKEIGKIRALKDDEICNVLGSDSETEEDSDDDELPDLTAILPDTSGKIPKVSSVKWSTSNIVTRTLEPVSERQSKTKLKDALKGLPLPKMVTPEKCKKEPIKSQSTVKKRFKCDECAISFSSRAELQEHDEEEHDDFKPISKTPTR